MPLHGLGFSDDLIVPEERDADSLGQQGVVSDIGAESKEAAAPIADINPNKLDFKNKPINSLLRVLANIGAGLQGKELPSDKLIEERRLLRESSGKRMKMGLELHKAVMEAIEKAPEDQKKAVAKTFTDQLRNNGFDDVADAILDTSIDEKTKEEIRETLGAEADGFLALASGNHQVALELALKPEVRKMVNESADEKNREIVSSKLLFMTGAIEQSDVQLPPEMFDLNGNLKIDSLAEVERASIAFGSTNPNAAFTPSEMGTLRRNPDLLLAVGIATPEIQKKRAEATPSIQITEQDGKKFAVGIDPNTGKQIFKTPLGDLEKKVNATEVKLAAQLIASGNTLPESFSKETKAIVGSMSQEDAATFLKTGQASGFKLTTITDSDGNQKQTITFGDVSPDDVEAKLQDKEINIRNFTREITNAISLVENNPNITTTLGAGFSRLVGSLEANVKSIIDIGGIDISKLSHGLDSTKYGKEVFGDLAGKSAAFKTLAFNLAVMAAATLQGQSNRALSDRDLELAMISMGTNIDDPDQVIASLKESRRLGIANFKTEFNVLTGGRQFTGLDEFLKTGNKFTAMSDEELDALSKNSDELEKLSTKDLELFIEVKNNRKSK